MLLLHKSYWRKATLVIERIVAVLTLGAVVWYGVLSAVHLAAMDWSQTATFQEFISRALIAIIGIELARTLLYHNVGSVLELLAFVIARKMLYPDLSSLDLLLNTGAFLLLMAARHFLMERKFYIE